MSRREKNKDGQRAGSRAEREIDHGKRLSLGDTEDLWGWGTAAGRLRAERRARLVAEGAGLGPGERVLEIGCGTGLFTEKFAEYGCEITAVEISPDLIGQAEKRGLDPERVKFVHSGFEEFGETGMYSAVIGSSVLHHLDMETAATRIFEFLKPGGVMCFAEPNMINPQVFMERRFRGWFPYVSPDETAFVRSGLGKLLKNAGFKDISIRPFDWLHPGTPGFMTGMVSAAGAALERAPLVREFSGSLLIRAARPED